MWPYLLAIVCGLLVGKGQASGANDDRGLLMQTLAAEQCLRVVLQCVPIYLCILAAFCWLIKKRQLSRTNQQTTKQTNEFPDPACALKLCAADRSTRHNRAQMTVYFRFLALVVNNAQPGCDIESALVSNSRRERLRRNKSLLEGQPATSWARVQPLLSVPGNACWPQNPQPLTGRLPTHQKHKLNAS